MNDELEPLGGIAARALAAERRRPDVVDAAMQERLLARVVTSVAVGAAVTGVAAGAKAAGAKAGAVTITGKVAAVVAAAFLAGGVTGAAIHAAVVPSVPAPSASVAPVVRAPAPSALTASVSPSDTVPSLPASALPAAPTPSAVGVPGPKPSATSSASADSDLAAERALVERARTAIGRGQPQDALVALDAHAAKFPRGRLSEEREALAVDALARAGRADDAKVRAARFHATYPNSVFGAVVDAAIAR